MKVLCVFLFITNMYLIDAFSFSTYDFIITVELFYFIFIFVPDGKEESLLEKRRQFSREVAQFKETYERLMSRFPNLRFDYK